MIHDYTENKNDKDPRRLSISTVVLCNMINM